MDMELFVNYIYQLVLAFIGSLGFSIIFRIRIERLMVASFGGIICWLIYFLCRDFCNMGIFVSSFLSTVGAAIYAECIAHYQHFPSIIMYIPGLVPLIPGSGLYYTMSHAVHGQWQDMLSTCYATMQCALGIAMGISIIYALCQLVEAAFKEAIMLRKASK